MKKTVSVIAFLCLTALAAISQTNIRVQAPNIVAADEQFNVTFIIEGEDAPSNFQWDAGSDFQLVWGPQKGTSTSISIVNGKKTRSAQSTYTYILLPKSTGRFNLPAATATLSGQTISSSPATVEVVSNGARPSSGGQSPSSGSQPQTQSGQQSATGDIPSSDLFLKLTLSRTSVVVGEPVTATLKLCHRVNIAGFEDVKFPTFNGFWSQEVLAPSNIEFKRENINDNIYNTAILRSWVIIPQQAGDITIDPSELICLVNVRVQSSARSIFDSFFEDDFRTIRKRIISDRCTVHVGALPAGAPASFGGGVGNFSITAKLSKDSLKTHDAASLLVTVSGKGNVSLLEAPKISFPPDFDVYDVKTVDNSDKSSGRTSGSKTFEYPFIPRSHGDFTIDPIEYSYYDVNSHKYATLATDAMQLKVAKGNEPDAPSTQGPIVSGVSRKDVRNLGSDIRYIVTKAPSWSEKGHSFCFSALFWLLTVLILAGATAAYFALRSIAARKADVVGTRNRGAVKMARRRLSQAGDYLQKNLHTAFYEELHRALLGYVSDKLNMDMSEMSKENIAASLLSSGVSEGLSDDFVGLLDACEFARYAPDSGHEAMNAHYENALSVIASIDGSMKKKRNDVSKAATAVVTLLLFVSLSARASETDASADSLWTAGVEAYAGGMWQAALDDWMAISESGIESVDLYYNIGNAYFKQDDFAHAILYYERALKLDPSAADVRFNLEFANQFVQDKIETVPEFFLSTWIRKVSHSLSSTAWSILFILMLALAASMCLMFILGNAKGLRRTGFYAGIAALILSLVCLGFAAGQRAAGLRRDYAIVVRPVSSVRSSPGAEAAKDLFVLHEGTKVKVLDEVGEWQNIELSDGRQGWVKSVDIELL